MWGWFVPRWRVFYSCSCEYLDGIRFYGELFLKRIIKIVNVKQLDKPCWMIGLTPAINEMENVFAVKENANCY